MTGVSELFLMENLGEFKGFLMVLPVFSIYPTSD